MKSEMNIQQLAAEVQRVHDSHKDYVTSTNNLWVDVDETAPSPDLKMQVRGHGEFHVNRVTHGQISSHLGIPKRYYDRMLKDAPDLLATNVNAWMRREPTDRMVRTIDDTARAFLSNAYRPIDNIVAMEAALPVLSERQDLRITAATLTETKLYVQAYFGDLAEDVELVPYSPGSSAQKATSGKVGDIINAGIMISNSEVGMGQFSVDDVIWRIICANMLVAARAFRRRHVGKRIDTGEDVSATWYSQETIMADNKAMLLKIRDAVRNAVSEENFLKIVQKAREAKGEEIPVGADLQAVVKEVGSRFTLFESEQDSVLRHLIDGGELTKWGMVNAVTATGRDSEDFDRGVELEQAGGQIIDLPQSAWKSITTPSRAAA